MTTTSFELRKHAPVCIVALGVAAGIVTCASTANSSRRTWDLLDAGATPIAPPYVEEDAATPYADVFEPFCDACAAAHTTN